MTIIKNSIETPEPKTDKAFNHIDELLHAIQICGAVAIWQARALMVAVPASANWMIFFPAEVGLIMA